MIGGKISERRQLIGLLTWSSYQPVGGTRGSNYVTEREKGKKGKKGKYRLGFKI